MIDRLLDRLKQAGLELDEEDIADSLWLAMKIESTLLQSQLSSTGSEIESADQSGMQQEGWPGHVNSSEEPPQGQNLAEDEDISPTLNAVLPIDNDSGSNAESETANATDLENQIPRDETTAKLPFKAPATTALQNALAVGRALRPLMRKVPSHTRQVLDEEATVSQIAERDLWLPVMKPDQERWLDLELVIEESRSSFIWQDAVDEFQQLMQCQGAFRNVRVWLLRQSEKGEPELYPYVQARNSSLRPRGHLELLGSSKRGLVLLVSDCTSNLWIEAKLHYWLQDWSQHEPTALIQLVPERLWGSSELGLGSKVQLKGLVPGVANPKLVMNSLAAWEREDIDWTKMLLLPVVTLRADPLEQWARMVSGGGSTGVTGILFDLEFVESQATQEREISVDLSSEELVDRFLTTASPIAQRLGGMMAAAPVSLPVVHLIQKELLPNSTPVHVAEVFLSGMIKRTSTVGEVDQYEFVDGARKLLNKAMHWDETHKVLNAVSKYVAEKIGKAVKSFDALLLEQHDWSGKEQAEIIPFARVSLEVLENLGGDYIRFADDFKKIYERKRKQNNYEIRSRKTVSGIAILAINGGNLQPGTTEIADAIAGNIYDFYSFVSLNDEIDQTLFTPSTDFAEPTALQIIQNAILIVSIQGTAGEDEFIELSGRDRELVNSVARELELHGFVANIVRSTGDLRKNICNRGRTGRGIQLEISRGLRDTIIGPKGESLDEPRLCQIIAAVKLAISQTVSDSESIIHPIGLEERWQYTPEFNILTFETGQFNLKEESTRLSRSEPYRASLISSFMDLADHRDWVIETLLDAGFRVDPVEPWTATTDEPKVVSLERVEGCDLCILLVGFRRGYVPDGNQLSITQIEYDKAVEEGCDVLTFLLNSEVTDWPREFDDRQSDPLVDEWRTQLEKTHVVGYFSEDPRSINIAPALTRWVQQREGLQEKRVPLGLDLLNVDKQTKIEMIVSRQRVEEKDESSESAAGVGPNPYKGLAAFQEEDAERYFGRRKQIDRLWKQFRELNEGEVGTSRVLPVLGPSESGKSSLVRAGLIPELVRKPLAGKEQARVLVFTPGMRPLWMLAGLLAGVADKESNLFDPRYNDLYLRTANDGGDFDGLQRIADLVPRIDSSPLILVVDQFEEIYAPDVDGDDRRAFIENLLVASGDRSGRVSVVLTLRSDFLGQTQRHPKLNEMIAAQEFTIPAMSAEELEEAIAKPAENAGRALDSGTVAQLVNETVGRKGALPLLQFALQQIWEGLREGKEPAQTLKEIGGVGGAVVNKAQQIYESLSDREKEIARRVFQGLVQLGEGAKVTCRRVEVASLISSQDDPHRVKQVIDRFSSVNPCLITLSATSEGEQTAELTHEALIYNWKQMSDWLDENKENIFFQLQLEEAARNYELAGRLEGNSWRAERVLNRTQHQVRYFPEMLGSDIEVDMIFIPGGTFQMGSPDDESQRRPTEGPQHSVKVPSFYLGRYPVTQEQWRYVANQLPQVNRELKSAPSRFEGDQHPVERVSWYEAVEFCDRLGLHTGRLYRLPTEAEWEYACRAGTTTPFNFGEILSNEVANYRSSSSYNGSPTGKSPGKPTSVDRYRIANAFGLCDMHGNVWEWCQDHWHDNYERAPKDGSAWLNDSVDVNESRIRRGGSCFDNPWNCRSAYRNTDDPRASNLNFGFRVVCSGQRALQ